MGWVLLCLSTLQVEKRIPLPLCPRWELGWLCRGLGLVQFHPGMHWGYDALPCSPWLCRAWHRGNQTREGGCCSRSLCGHKTLLT